MSQDLWAGWHKRALNFKGKDDSPYLREFGQKIPRFTTGCKCKEFWNRWLKQNPPVYGNKYFEYTVKCHNAVNKKLGKPEYTVEQARTFYSKSM